MSEYPKYKYNDPSGPESCVVVNSEEEELALGSEWKDHWLKCAKSDDGEAAIDPDTTAEPEVAVSSPDTVTPILIAEMTKAQLIEALRALGETANATMSKDALTEKLQKAQSQE